MWRYQRYSKHYPSILVCFLLFSAVVRWYHHYRVHWEKPVVLCLTSLSSTWSPPISELFRNYLKEAKLTKLYSSTSLSRITDGAPPFLSSSQIIKEKLKVTSLLFYFFIPHINIPRRKLLYHFGCLNNETGQRSRD